MPPSSYFEIPPGPNAGRIWRDRALARKDALTGQAITQVTNYRGHSLHVIGGQTIWLEGGARLLLVSDRDGCGNLFAYDFGNATLCQLTDLRGAGQPERARLAGETRLDFRYDGARYELELHSLRLRRCDDPQPARRRRVVVPSFSKDRCGVMRSRAHGSVIWITDTAVASARERRALAVIEESRVAPAVIAPSFSPDGKKVIFAAPAEGYVQVCVAEPAPLATLPLLSARGALTPVAASAPRAKTPRA